jgi:metal-sulfur cluster biosynthetic enzyme
VIDQARVWSTLNTIVDPCSRAAGAPAGIAEMGLVRQIEVQQSPGGASIRVVIGVTEPGCLMGAAFVNDANKLLRALPDVAEVHVSMDHAFDWTPKNMSPAYQARLHQLRQRRRATLGMIPLNLLGEA